MGETPAATSERARLGEVRLKILHLHKALLEIERKNYERIHGIVNSGELLLLAINHPQFAWLRIVSALVVQIDEMLDADELAVDEDVSDLITQARQLFTSPDNEEFRHKYQRALQEEPEVVMAHSELMKLLR